MKSQHSDYILVYNKLEKDSPIENLKGGYNNELYTVSQRIVSS